MINVGEVDCGNPANDAANPASVTTKVFSVEMGTYRFLVIYVQPLISKVDSKFSALDIRCDILFQKSKIFSKLQILCCYRQSRCQKQDVT